MEQDKGLERLMKMGKCVGFFVLLMIVAPPRFGHAVPKQEVPEFTEAEIFLELNDTDGDLGLHASIDGGPYVVLTIEDPKGRTIFALAAFGKLAQQGLTQLALESAEPDFEELPPDKFFRRFPEGLYEIEGRTRRHKSFEATALLSHVLAAPPENILISGVPAAEDCDAVLPVVSAPVIIEWDPVTESHPELGESGAVEIVRYQLFVGRLAVDLPPTVTQ